MKTLTRIAKTFKFHAAHQLCREEWTEEKNLEVYGKCTRLHGHTYQLTVVVEGTPDDSGMLINFRDLKEIVTSKVVSRYDHILLNDLSEFKNLPTTSEFIARIIFDKLEPLLEKENVCLAEIRLKESPTSEAIVSRNF